MLFKAMILVHIEKQTKPIDTKRRVIDWESRWDI